MWYFDTNAGKKEILYRRIGWNEASAIRICQELVAAQKDYYSKQNNEYAQKIFSDEGKHDGLYWKVSERRAAEPDWTAGGMGGCGRVCRESRGLAQSHTEAIIFTS